MELNFNSGRKEDNSHVERPALSMQTRILDAKQAILEQKVFSSHEISAELAELPSLADSVRSAGMFGHSLRSFLLYAQCGTPDMRSPGLYLQRDGISFAVGLFSLNDQVAMHIVAPQGGQHHQYVTALSRWLIQNKFIDIAYVRQVSPSDAELYETLGFENLKSDTDWNERAPFEDETFNHRLIDLEACVELDEKSTLSVKSLPDGGSSNFRSKFRLAYQRCQNFLDRNNLTFSFRQLNVGDIPTARKLIQDHFAVLEASGKAVGSCALDYELLLTNSLPDNEQYVSLLGVLRSQDKELVASVFLGERTGDTTGGLYCSITNRNADSLHSNLPGIDLTGFTALPQFALAAFFGHLLKRGWRTVDLGGSETEDLDRFKRQMGATEFETTWRVMKR